MDQKPGDEVDEDALETVAPEHPIRCAACGHIVTSRESAIAVDGRHDHRCINPHGIFFDIGCYREAPGVMTVGMPESYFSWFRGTAWQIALCGACHVHLGWSFTGRDAPFVGLIQDRVVP